MDKIIEQRTFPWLEYHKSMELDSKDIEYFKDHSVCITSYEKEDGSRYIGISSFDGSESLENHDLTKYRYMRPDFHLN